MEDWVCTFTEDEPVPPILKKEELKSMWDDEDVDENDVKDSWDDEDEPIPASAPEPPAKKVSKEPVTKSGDKKGKAAKVLNQEPASVPLDPVTEKLRQQRLVEEADYKSTKELFAKKGDEKTLDSFIPTTESGFNEYAELVSQKIRPYEKSFHYIGLLKAVVRLSLTNKAADAKEIASSVTAIANEKLKAEKEANAGKRKTGVKKKQIHVGRLDDGVMVDTYDAIDDYDFI